jgi:hypothetical protein
MIQVSVQRVEPSSLLHRFLIISFSEWWCILEVGIGIVIARYHILIVHSSRTGHSAPVHRESRDSPRPSIMPSAAAISEGSTPRPSIKSHDYAYGDSPEALSAAGHSSSPRHTGSGSQRSPFTIQTPGGQTRSPASGNTRLSFPLDDIIRAGLMMLCRHNQHWAPNGPMDVSSCSV